MPSRRKELLTLVNESDIISAIHHHEIIRMEWWKHPRIETISDDSPISESYLYIHEKNSENVRFNSALITDSEFIAFGYWHEPTGGIGYGTYRQAPIAIKHRHELTEQGYWLTFLDEEVAALRKENK